MKNNQRRQRKYFFCAVLAAVLLTAAGPGAAASWQDGLPSAVATFIGRLDRLYNAGDFTAFYRDETTSRFKSGADFASYKARMDAVSAKFGKVRSRESVFVSSDFLPSKNLLFFRIEQIVHYQKGTARQRMVIMEENGKMALDGEAIFSGKRTFLAQGNLYGFGPGRVLTLASRWGISPDVFNWLLYVLFYGVFMLFRRFTKSKIKALYHSEALKHGGRVYQKWYRSSPYLEIPYKGATVLVYSVSSRVRWTVFQCALPHWHGQNMRISPHVFIDVTGRIMGGQRVETGDPAFDRAFDFFAKDPMSAQMLLDAQTRSALMDMKPFQPIVMIFNRKFQFIIKKKIGDEADLDRFIGTGLKLLDRLLGYG